MKRPETLTPDRVRSVLPDMDVNPEWERKNKAGELPEGIRGAIGMFVTVWPEDRLTREEAEYVLWLGTQGSLRWVASELLDGDDNQVHGVHAIEAAERAIAVTES